MPGFTPSEIILLNSLTFVASLLSLFGSFFIILSYLLFPHLRQFRHRTVLALSFSDFVFSLNLLLSSGSAFAKPLVSGTACTINGFITQWFIVSTDYWIFVIALSSFLGLFKRDIFSKNWAESKETVIHLIVWNLSLLTAVISFVVTGFVSVGSWCWIPISLLRFFVNYIPRYAIILVIVGFYGYLIRYLRVHVQVLRSVQNNNSDTKDPISNNVTRYQNVMRHMLFYPLTYIGLWTFPIINRIVDLVIGPVLWLTVLEAFCVPLQGFADAIVYGMNENLIQEYRNLFKGVKSTTFDDSQDA